MVTFIQTFYSNAFKKQIKLFSYGAAQPQLPIATLKNIKILVPCKSIQEKYSNNTEKNINLICTLQNQNQHLKEARDTLLPRLMTGMIDVDKLKVEPEKKYINNRLPVYS